MKKPVLLLSTAACALIATAQVERITYDEETWKKEFGKCGTMENLERLKKLDPGLEQRMADYEARIQEFLAQHPNGKLSPFQTITIPTVVHVVWNTAAENISDNSVNNIITVLNEDYGRTNPDASQTPSVWQSIAVNTGIQFCLAVRDPSGNPTNGIVRVQTAQTSFTTDDKVKFTAQGGSDSWTTTQYFNIWICDLGGGLGGYGEFPSGSPSNTWGNVTDYALVGGYVCSHESGHCFDLYHIWGDDGGSCSGSDAVSDTPNQADATNASCSTFPTTDACSPSSPGIMYMNYMDYTWSCTNLFTQGQSSRANAALFIPPYNALASSQGCVPVNLVANDAGITVVSSPNGLICSGNFTPVVTLKNWGNNNLTSCVINYQVDANPPQTYNWSGTLASLATATVTLSSMTVTAGTHTFTCYTSNPNTTTDGNTNNDQAASTFSSGVSSLPLVEGFQSTFPPTGWSLSNPNGDVTWVVHTTIGNNSTQSVYLDNCTQNTTSTQDQLRTPQYDFTSVTSPQMTFDVAYAPWDNQYSDTLAAYYSTNCGSTWTQLYSKGGTTLASVPCTMSQYQTTCAPYDIGSGCFGPNGSSAWRTETITLNSLIGQGSVMFAFENRGGYGSNLFIDNINITSAIGTSEMNIDPYISIFPNPMQGAFTVYCGGLKAESIMVFDVVGQRVYNFTGNVSALLVDLSHHSDGMYFVEVKTANGTAIKKALLGR